MVCSPAARAANKPVAQIFEGEAALDWKSKPLQCKEIGLGIRLHPNDILTAHRRGEQALPGRPEPRAHQRLDIGPARRSDDGEAQTSHVRLLDQPPHAGPQRSAAGLNPVSIVRVLTLMQRLEFCLDRGDARGIVDAGAMRHTLVAVRQAKEFVVMFLFPMPGNFERGESFVECTPMPVLGLGEGAVDVEWKGMQRDRRASESSEVVHIQQF